MARLISARVKFNKIPGLIDNLDAVKRIANRAFAEEVKNEAVRLVPVDTGALQRSIRVAQLSGEPDALHVIAGGGTEQVDYALFVEFGTVRMAPQPFMGPAYAKKSQSFNFRNIIGQAIVDAVTGRVRRVDPVVEETISVSRILGSE